MWYMRQSLQLKLTPCWSSERFFGEKPYKYDECGKVFGQKAHLRLHWRVHAGERPLRCDECGKFFSRNSHLTSHRRIRIVKPYKCFKCGKSFTQVSALTKHQKIHTWEKSMWMWHMVEVFKIHTLLLVRKFILLRNHTNIMSVPTS